MFGKKKKEVSEVVTNKVDTTQRKPSENTSVRKQKVNTDDREIPDVPEGWEQHGGYFDFDSNF